MALTCTGRVLNAQIVAERPAVGERLARPAHVKLDVYEKNGKQKKTKMYEIKAPLARHEEFVELLDEIVSFPVEFSAFQDELYLTLNEDIEYQVHSAK